MSKENPQTGPKGIDWRKAFTFYCEPNPDGTLKALKDVAKEFDVAERNVEIVSSREKWVDRRDKIGEEALQEFKKLRKESIAKISMEHAKIWKMFQGVVVREVREFINKKEDSEYSTKDFKRMAEIMKMAINGQRVILGLPITINKETIKEMLEEEFELSAEEIENIDNEFQQDFIDSESG